MSEKYFGEVCKEISPMGWKVLKFLKKQDSNHKEMGERLSLSQRKIEIELNRLQGALLVKRFKNDKDWRFTACYTITEYGLDAIEMK